MDSFFCNLTGQMYLQLLEDAIDPALTDITDYDEDHLIFQQDGGPPHYALIVRQYLDQRFPRNWIGRRGSIEWPLRLLDLSLLDFFVKIPKSKIYKTQRASL